MRHAVFDHWRDEIVRSKGWGLGKPHKLQTAFIEKRTGGAMRLLHQRHA
jgi:hypothetical protein